MKKIIALLSIAIVGALTLTACSSSNVVYSGEYDETKYTQSSDIAGTSFLMPNDIYKIREEATKMQSYKADELQKHVFQTADEANYMLYQPGKFILYVFDLGTDIKTIADKHDVSEIPALIGTSSWLAFSAHNPNTYTAKNKDGNIQILYGSYITEKLTGAEITYCGYVTILKDSDSGKSYCLIVGYDDEKMDSSAEDLAKNFLLQK